MPASQDDTAAEQETSWRFEEGQDITDRYIAMKVLGGGHSYEVYLAQDQHRLALVVVKLLRPHLIEDDHERQTLAREVEAVERLAHPVIVRGFGADLEGERPHIVLEHLEGPHLSRLIRQYPLALEQVLPLAIQICSAIHYMAMEDMVHLDVKPRNIIMGAPPRLIDLSIARSTERAARLSGPVGTDPYMAPEQCDPGRATVGPAADLWGIGVTLHHAITGRLPFPRVDDYDKSDPAQRWPQLEREPDPMSDEVPPLLREIVMETLSPEPAERPTAVEVVARLEPLVAQLPSRPVLRRLRPRLTSRKKNR
jgi:eukaryotic-like serine/threonine-protein kinase